jgi:hypothetical protein
VLAALFFLLLAVALAYAGDWLWLATPLVIAGVLLTVLRDWLASRRTPTSQSHRSS